MPTYEAARALAKVAFNEQYDKSGQPMIDHALRVAEIAARLTDDRDAEVVALLHDIIEDSNLTSVDLKDLGYSPRVVDALKLLTHDIQEDSYEEYVSKIATSGNRLAIIVKLADNLDNSRPDRHTDLTPKVSAQLLERYEKARQILTGTNAKSDLDGTGLF